MAKLKIYTIGAMKNKTLEDTMHWREELISALKFHDERTPKVITPPIYYNYTHHYQKSEKEIKDWELAQLKKCDVAVVNLDDVNNSVGSHYELATVDAFNKSGGHIFVIGIGDPTDVHPWIVDSCFRIEPTIEDAALYIMNYLNI